MCVSLHQLLKSKRKSRLFEGYRQTPPSASHAKLNPVPKIQTQSLHEFHVQAPPIDVRTVTDETNESLRLRNVRIPSDLRPLVVVNLFISI